jgi:hypothetical protein
VRTVRGGDFAPEAETGTLAGAVLSAKAASPTARNALGVQICLAATVVETSGTWRGGEYSAVDDEARRIRLAAARADAVKNS